MTFVKRLLALGLLGVTFAANATPAIQHWVTANGARVYFVESHQLPMVQVRMVFDAGSARDSDAEAGLARLTNTLLDDGAGELNANQIASGFDDLGAEFSASSHRDMAVLNLRSLSGRKLLDPALALMAKVAAKPTFPSAALDRERQRALIGLQQADQSPEDVAERTFFHQLYGDHPYGRDPRGTVVGLKAITRADLVRFHQRYYVGANLVVALVGDLSRDEARKVADRLTSALPRGQVAPALPPVPALTRASEKQVAFPSTQAHLLMGQPGISRGDPDYFPLLVGNYTLGGGGLVSRLAESVREKQGLAYSVYSYFFPMHTAGPFIVGLQTKNTQIHRALTIARKTVDDFVANGPTADELKAAKQHMTGSFPLRIDSDGKIAQYLAMIGFYNLPLTYLDDFIGNVKAVTADQVRDAFKRRVHPDRFLTVVVGGK